MTGLVTRRTVLGATAGAAALRITGASAQVPPLPKSPVTINIVDVAGNLALTQKAFEAYAKAKPNLVSQITFTKAPAPELPGKIKAQQDADRVDIDLVLTGTDALSAGIEQKLWIQLLPAYAASLPKLDDIYLPAAVKMQALAKGQGVVVTYYPSGPLLEYMPDRVKTAADHGRGAARLGEGQPEPLHLRAPGQFRPRPHLPDGPALHPRRQGPEGSGQGLGQDLGLSQGARRVHRVLPDRHRRHDEGTRRGLARHDRVDDRLGHQSARPRRRAEGGRRSSR